MKAGEGAAPPEPPPLCLWRQEVVGLTDATSDEISRSKDERQPGSQEGAGLGKRTPAADGCSPFLIKDRRRRSDEHLRLPVTQEV